MKGATATEPGVYGQLMREVFTHAQGLPGDDVLSVALDARGWVWVATGRGVACYDGNEWRAFGSQQGLGRARPFAIAAVGETVWAASPRALHRLQGETFEQVIGGAGAPPANALAAETAAPPSPAGPFVALRASQGKLLAAGSGGVSSYDGASWEHIAYPQRFAVTDLLLDGEGVLWLATDNGLWSWRDSSWQAHLPATEHSGPPAPGITALGLDGAGALWVGTTAGIGLFDRGDWWEQIKGAHGLPCEKVTSIAIAADGTVWAGLAIGCARLRAGEWDYFANLRWLPDDGVRALAVGADGAAWVATGKGLSRIYEQPMTLAQKAAHFEERIQKRHYRMGYVADNDLAAPGDVEHFTHEATDNDGLWTAIYVGAQCYRYAVTGEAAAHDAARTSVYALIELERKSTVPGLPARAIIGKNEPGARKSGGEWHDSEDGQWEWKGDTSSDEIDGHFFAYGLYYDLVADATPRSGDDSSLRSTSDADKEAMRSICRRIMDHIIEHGYYLVDTDGKPTRWGVWPPEMLNGPWEAQRGLNSLEILAYLKTAYHVTGDEKYQQHYLHLARDHHYALNTLYQKLDYPNSINHSDDELAILAYHVLLLYEEDPALRAIYLASLERTWRIERPEHSPFQNYIYGALTGKRCDVEESLAELRDIPWETVQWRMNNAHRADLVEDVRMGRFGERQATTAIKAHERGILRWNGNPYRLDSGGSGTREEDGAHFLLPYWMGRYYGFIVEQG